MLKVIDSAVPVACWSCAVAHNDVTLSSRIAGKISNLLRRRLFFCLWAGAAARSRSRMLEHQFHKLSRLHPDRFARAQENESGVSPIPRC